MNTGGVLLRDLEETMKSTMSKYYHMVQRCMSEEIRTQRTETGFAHVLISGMLQAIEILSDETMMILTWTESYKLPVCVCCNLYLLFNTDLFIGKFYQSSSRRI